MGRLSGGGAAGIEENALRADLENSIGVLERYSEITTADDTANGIDTVIAGSPCRQVNAYESSSRVRPLDSNRHCRNDERCY